MANTYDKVIKIAEAEIGYLEKSKAAYQKNPKILDEKTKGAGSDNYTKFGRDMHKLYPQTMDFPAAWCDCFVDWCFQKAYGVSTAKSLLGGFDDYTVASADKYKSKGAYIKRGEGKPKPGDQIFFKNTSRICHTGLVYKVDNNYVYTIEGNTSGASGVVANGGGVKKKSYSLNSAYIDGYGRPKYDPVLPKVAKPILKRGDEGTEVKRLQKDLNYLGYVGKDKKKLVVDGEFGPNTEYAVIQFKISRLLTNQNGIYDKEAYTLMKKLIK